MTIRLHGIEVSTYVRTTRWTAEELRLDYELKDPNELSAAHPYGKIPSLADEDLVVHEASAICRYLDSRATDRTLIPACARDQARMEEWISTTNSYLYPRLIKGYALLYAVPLFNGEEPDHAKIDRALPEIERELKRLDQRIGDAPFAVGDGLTLADTFLGPVLDTVTWFTDGRRIVDSCANIRRLLSSYRTRPAYQTIDRRPFDT